MQGMRHMWCHICGDTSRVKTFRYIIDVHCNCKHSIYAPQIALLHSPEEIKILKCGEEKGESQWEENIVNLDHNDTILMYILCTSIIVLDEIRPYFGYFIFISFISSIIKLKNNVSY